MKEYEFKYTARPASFYYDNDKRPDFWLDCNNQYVTIAAENIKEAAQKFQEHMDYKWCYEISKTALAKPQPMYIDRKDSKPIQIGYVYKAACEIQWNDYSWHKRWCEIWTEIKELSVPDFEEDDVAA